MAEETIKRFSCDLKLSPGSEEALGQSLLMAARMSGGDSLKGQFGRFVFEVTKHCEREAPYQRWVEIHIEER